MEIVELIQHWNYSCSFAERLDDTKHYIDYGLVEHNCCCEKYDKNNKVYATSDCMMWMDLK